MLTAAAAAAIDVDAFQVVLVEFVPVVDAAAVLVRIEELVKVLVLAEVLVVVLVEMPELIEVLVLVEVLVEVRDEIVVEILCKNT